MFLEKYWWWYFGALLADVVCLLAGATQGHFWLKIVLMPLLIVGLINNKKATKQGNWELILAGLFLAWAGDVLLLFTSKSPLFFMFGLGCFLLTHLCYIRYFSKYHRGQFQWLAEHPALPLCVSIYAILLTVVLFPNLGALKTPVVIYVFAIAVMALSTIASQPYLPKSAYRWFLAGAVLFVASDSVLAIDKFMHPTPWAGALLMATYGMAQFGFVRGAVINTDAVAQPLA